MGGIIPITKDWGGDMESGSEWEWEEGGGSRKVLGGGRGGEK